MSTLGKVEGALGWTPGTIDRLARATTDAVPMDVAAITAMLRAIEHELTGATQAWAEATMRLQEAQIAAKAAEDRRAQLALDHARLSRRMTELAQEGARDEGPTMNAPA